jgi:hypothetical protein
VSPTYAQDTKVAPEASRAEIERTLARYGATSFMYGWEDDRAVVQFRAQERYVRFVLSMPPLEDFATTPGGRRRRAYEQMVAEREKAMRQRWRVLALAVKAKLESVEAGLESFEDAFLAHILLPDGSTVGESATSAIAEAYETGEMPRLLPPPQD